jgi:hypothetical protein
VVTLLTIAEWNLLAKSPIVWTARLLNHSFPWLFPSPASVVEILRNICQELEIDDIHLGVVSPTYFAMHLPH